MNDSNTTPISPASPSNPVARRRFLKTASAIGSLTCLCGTRSLHGSSNSRSSRAETVIGELYESLTDQQRRAVCKGMGDPLRQQVNPNWHVVKPTIGNDFYSSSQRAMAREIVRGLTSPSGLETITKQMEDDDGGLEAYSMAWFGQPGSDAFEWMLTGRHLTLRADGNTQKKVVFGGPIVYGHGEESSPEDNLFYFQTVKVNAIYQSLSSDQREVALLKKSIPAENKATIEKIDPFPGLAVSQLDASQQLLVTDALTSILGVYRAEDVKEADELIADMGGIAGLSLQYYSNDDLKDDGIWDMWRIVGKNVSIHFRGAPHVHAYIHIQSAAI